MLCKHYQASYSRTKQYEANQIINYILRHVNNYSSSTITDGTAGAGGDSINFSKYFKNVNSVEMDNDIYNMLLKNAELCKNINFINEDYLEIYKNLHQDVIYLDPPWGGPNYKLKKEVCLYISNKPLYIVIEQLMEQFKIDIFVKVPLNVCTINFKNYTSEFIYNKSKFKSFKLLHFIP